MVPAPPRVLAIAGEHPGGGAGIQADLKTLLALGVHGMTTISAVTAQNSVGVQGYWELPAEAVAAQLLDLGARRGHRRAGDQDRHAGLLLLVGIVSDALAEVAAPVVVDLVARQAR